MKRARWSAEDRAYFRSLGKFIAERRKELGMTQAEMARELKVCQQTVFAYELGDRMINIVMLRKLAGIFQVSVEELSGMRMKIRPKRRLSPAGIRHADRYRSLGKTRQRFVARLIDLLLLEQAALASK